MSIEWFDYDNHLTWEVKKALDNNWKIDSDEARFMADIIDKYWRWNIKIKKSELIKLWKEFWYNYSKLSKIWPSLERRIKERVNVVKSTKNELLNVKKSNLKNNDSISNNDFIKKLEKQFPSIDNIENFINSLKKLKNTREIVSRKISESERNNYSDNTLVTISYYWKNRDKVRVSDLRWILKSINFTLDIDKKWVEESVDWKVNYKAIKKAVDQKMSKEKITWLTNILANSVKYVWQTETNAYLRKEIRKHTWLDIRSQAWCAAFVKMILIKSGYKNYSDKMNNTALSAFWITKTWWHIWISAWWGRFIDWNSWASVDRVTKDSVYRWYRSKGFIWWILPQDIWDKSKVNYWKSNIPPGAIIVFARWKNVVQKAKYTKLYLQWKVSKDVFNKYT